MRDQHTVPVCSRREHELAKMDHQWWLQLEYVGEQLGARGIRLELRNCGCGSTLAKEIK